MSAPRVLGLDLSLTATGVARPDGTTVTWSPKEKGTERLATFVNLLEDEIRSRKKPADHKVDVVVLEQYAFSRSGAHAKETGELGGVVRLALWRMYVPFVAVLPNVLKRYATGRGNATKPDMRMALFQRCGLDLRDDNQVDAFWLRAMALDAYGCPVVDLPATNREALAKVEWPEIVRTPTS